MSDSRIGQGFDVHRFAAGRRLVLCGLELPGWPGLEGHSDADVALHAVADALLGAVAAGDIGERFPSSDDRWRDAESRLLIEGALELVAKRGYRLINCDLTVVCQRPRIAPHRGALRKRLAEILGVELGAVSVKATTSDGLGFAGRGEGMAAMAVVLLQTEDVDG